MLANDSPGTVIGLVVVGILVTLIGMTVLGRRSTFPAPPHPALDALNDLRGRYTSKASELRRRADQAGDPADRSRLHHKADGLTLAVSILNEMIEEHRYRHP